MGNFAIGHVALSGKIACKSINAKLLWPQMDMFLRNANVWIAMVSGNRAKAKMPDSLIA